jgi:hypothetical protein
MQERITAVHSTSGGDCVADAALLRHAYAVVDNWSLPQTLPLMLHPPDAALPLMMRMPLGGPIQTVEVGMYHV